MRFWEGFMEGAAAKNDRQMAASAAHELGLRAAEGYGVAQDWKAALDHLAAAAKLGHTLAQATLAGLTDQWALAHRILEGETGHGDWMAWRGSIDIAATMRVGSPRILSVNPRIAMLEAFASPQVCDWLVARAKPKLIPARLYDPSTGDATQGGARTSSERHFPWAERDLIFAILRERIAIASELPVAAMEPPTIMHYLPGQEFLPHFDFLDPKRPGLARNVASNGQRVLTFLISLNDGYDGGETEFPALRKRFKGRKGHGFFFWNVDVHGAIDPRTLHAGLPPKSGEKWLLSQWIRDRAFDKVTAEVQ
jgi:prolyl 4-hydroxylase